MNRIAREPYQDPQRSRRRQDYAYRIAAAVAALFLLLTWLSA
jgi:ferric-dicitrate binding protein FerR (iron transport regulator)